MNNRLRSDFERLYLTSYTDINCGSLNHTIINTLLNKYSLLNHNKKNDKILSVPYKTL